MTEAEAREKWCPHTRRAVHYGPNTVAVNVEDSNYSRCIASGCMMWVSEGREQDAVKDFGEMKGRCGLAK